MKSSPSALLFLRKKLSSCSLFRTYAQAFEVATGHRLSLQEKSGAVSAPVRIGKVVPFYLVAEGGDVPVLGFVESFALQLAEDANAAMLETDGVDPVAVKDAKTFIHDHLRVKISLDEVADAVGICSFQLCRLFKRHTGMTMTEYVSRLRVEQARKMLRDPGYQISEISCEVGFTSLSQFNRNFLKYSGESPSEYRERLKALEHCHLEVA